MAQNDLSSINPWNVLPQLIHCHRKYNVNCENLLFFHLKKHIFLEKGPDSSPNSVFTSHARNAPRRPGLYNAEFFL